METKLKPRHPPIMLKDAKTISPTEIIEKEMNKLINSRRLGKIQQVECFFVFSRYL